MPKTRSRARRGVLCGLLFALASLAGCGNNEPISSRPAFLVPQDYPTIQAAVDAATPGSIVLVEPGVYTHAGHRDYANPEFPEGARAAIHMRSNVWVQGRGALGSVVVRDTSAAGDTLADYGALLVDVNDGATLENIVFESFPVGVAVVGSTGNVVSCRVTGSDIGIRILDCAGQPWARGNLVENCRLQGILTEVSDPWIFENIVRGCPTGIGAERAGTASVFNNILCGNGVGLGTNTGATPVAVRNVILENAVAGVLTADGAVPLVKENDIFENGVDYWIAQYDAPLQDTLCATDNYWASVDTLHVSTVLIRDRRTDETSGGYAEYLPILSGPVYRSWLGIDPRGVCGQDSGELARRMDGLRSPSTHLPPRSRTPGLVPPG